MTLPLAGTLIGQYNLILSYIGTFFFFEKCSFYEKVIQLFSWIFTFSFCYIFKSTYQQYHIHMLTFRIWKMGHIFNRKKITGYPPTFFFFQNTLKCCNNNRFVFTVFNIFFLSLKYKYTIMCNYFNNYDNLNGCMLITFGVHLYEKCITYLSGKFSKLCSN